MPTLIVTLSAAAASAACDAVVDLCDVGGAGTVEIQNSTNVVLAAGPLANPAFGAATTGTAIATVPIVAAHVAPGTAHHYAVKNNAGVGILTGPCGVTGSGQAMELDSLTVLAGQDVTIGAWSHTQPAS